MLDQMLSAIRMGLSLLVLIPILIFAGLDELVRAMLGSSIKRSVDEDTPQLTEKNDPKEPTPQNGHEAAAREGYILEDHHVITSDGYVLMLHRLRSEQEQKPPESRMSILLQHGLYQSSMLFLVNQKQHSLAFLLVDSGYDVWLGNTRGNIHSCRHVCLCPSGPAFWSWSLEDLALDVKANVEYIATNQDLALQKLVYIGHSQGSSQALVAFSIYPELRTLVHGFVALAPGAFVNTLPSMPLRSLAILATCYPTVFRHVFGSKNFLPILDVLRPYVPHYDTLAYVCFKSMFGWTDRNWDQTRRPAFFAETPAGTSVRTIVQWLQHSRTGRFQHFCFGPAGNVRQYGQMQAPEFAIEQMDIPTMVIVGGQDRLLDFHLLLRRLRRCLVGFKVIPHHEHLDSVLAIDAHEHVFPSIFEFIRTFERTTDVAKKKKKKMHGHRFADKTLLPYRRELADSLATTCA